MLAGELADLRGRYEKNTLLEQPKSESWAAQDVLRLLEHIAELEGEIAKLLEYKNKFLARDRTLNEGWPDRR